MYIFLSIPVFQLSKCASCRDVSAIYDRDAMHEDRIRANVNQDRMHALFVFFTDAKLYLKSVKCNHFSGYF